MTLVTISVRTKKLVKAKNREHLKELIAEAIAKNGPQYLWFL